MKDLNKFIAFALTAIICLTINGCAGNGGAEVVIEKPQYKQFAFGKWENDTFTSEWLGITFILPEKMKRLSAQELTENYGFEPNRPVNEGLPVSEEVLADESISSYYDLALEDSSGALCLSLSVTDTQKSLFADISATNYAKNLRDALDNKGVTLTANEIATIGGKDYIRFESSLNAYVKSVYYIAKHEGLIVSWITVEYVGQNPEMNDFLGSILPLETSITP